ncbi:response regulator [Massilia sp. TW-1]|uniref:histidine kinase n=1 Tax=Telluria antibiotica TaxID=2717319 RepID=A0ABX0P6P1_9BURK|nr:PAS domain-containing hybrid sensor histidine kinase/response regulator [Telluria antibiotica]NIA52288.1 response regulator [Telluria antibiotica]
MPSNQSNGTPVTERRCHTRLVGTQPPASNFAATAPCTSRPASQQTERVRDTPCRANGALVVHDEAGQIVFVNKQGAELLDSTAEALVQMNVRELAAQGHGWLSPRDLPSMSRNQPISMDTAVLQRFDQKFLVEVQRERIKIDGRNFYLHTVRDISQQLQTKEALQRLNTHLEEQVAIRTARLREEKVLAEGKSKAKTDFLARMSHEIRTPMGLTISLTDLALAHATDPRQRDYLSKIRMASTHLLSVVDDILDLSKIEANKFCLRPADFDFRLFFEGLKCLSQSAADKGLTLSFHSDPQLHRTIRADSGRLKQVLLNYISNAIKFTTAGRIEVRASLRSAPDGAPEILFEVADTGIGLTPSQIQQLFQPFYQAGNPEINHDGSTGLGLSICKQLVKLMGGKIGVNSTAGVGSTFWVQIPIKWGKAIGGHGTARANGDQARKQLQCQVSERDLTRVLVADDNKVNQQIVLEMLAPCGIETVVADDGRAALEVLARQRIDCILMDLQMPEMDGYAAIQAIRRNPATAPPYVIALTADVLVDNAQRCSDSGFDAILTKPFSPRALYQHISEALSRSQPVPEQPDQTGGLSRWTGGDSEAALRLRELFLLVALDCSAQIRKACAARRSMEIARQTHKLLPSARMVDAVEVARLCTELDGQLADPDWHHIARISAALDEVLDQMMSAQSAALPPRKP